MNFFKRLFGMASASTAESKASNVTRGLRPFGNAKRLARYARYLFFCDPETARSYFADWAEMAKRNPPSTVVEIQLVEFYTSLEEFKHWLPKPERWAIVHPYTGDDESPLDQWTRKCKGQLNNQVHPVSYGANEYADVRRWISRVLAWEILLPSDVGDDPSKYQSFLVDEAK